MEGEAIWRKEGERKRSAVHGMFADIASGYDRMNGLMSFGLHHRWRTFAVAQLRLSPGNRVLDVCCGTGDFMVPLRKAVGPAGQVFGVDFCLPMLEGAREKLIPSPTVPPFVPQGEPSLMLGDACRLPIASGAFDGVSVGWGLRNVPDLDGALGEAARVLKSGGRFVSLDMARPRNPIVRKTAEFALRRALPVLGKLLKLGDEAYAYLPESTLRFASRETLAAAMERAGFVDVAYRDLMFGNLCVHWGRKS
jgi:demethylmenaquinone methyltransferase/2-methoxy-6-polyprenyl-1,4-benzoquinol methylase